MPSYVQHFIEPMLDPMAQTAVVGVCLLISLDLVVGIVGAIATHTFSSERMRTGLLHKFTELACIAMAIVLDGILMGGLDLGIEPVLMATCSYIVVMETGSFLELVKLYNPDATGMVAWLTAFVSPKGVE